VPELLKDLNSNIETPLLLWNTACRLEVMAYIESRMKRSSTAVDYSPDDAQNFVYQTLAKELQIGGVYVRLYNE
jgi:DnaJ family protein C protein 13